MYTGYIYIYTYIQLVRRYLVFSRNSENTSGVGKSRFFRKLLLRPSFIRSCLRQTRTERIQSPYFTTKPHFFQGLTWIAALFSLLVLSVGSSGRTTANTEEVALARKHFFAKATTFISKPWVCLYKCVKPYISIGAKSWEFSETMPTWTRLVG